jgi:hypothetical protein
LSFLHFFYFVVIVPLHCPRIATNGMAAWRSGGFYALPFKFALPAAVAPNRSLGAGIFSVFKFRIYYFVHKFAVLE